MAPLRSSGLLLLWVVALMTTSCVGHGRRGGGGDDEGDDDDDVVTGGRGGDADSDVDGDGDADRPADCSGAGGDDCQVCLSDYCCEQALACDLECSNFLNCVVSCMQGGSEESYCEDLCYFDFPDGESTYLALRYCLDAYCDLEC